METCTEEEAGQDDVETLIPFVVDSSLVVGAVVVEPFELAAGWGEAGAGGRAAAGAGSAVETSSAVPGAAVSPKKRDEAAPSAAAQTSSEMQHRRLQSTLYKFSFMPVSVHRSVKML